ncbi:hypothetical protein MCOR19_009259 [Pyricularia oryzae]|nr:hypothetical protein MCOR19_009259 [Pyricularia oryzae]KAI6472588.1 hypothetical protein MCOR15_000355 [Pyricularia oryzae]KAI6489265.1 hypothetical protein MCOR18_002689 [Pyricularia oryzae]KAI6517937.1 hypothetical protein MCOR16_009223 [Pyricularia oryzae]KAI6584023.1 hypothetical protein MCOR06_007791 [Pyricularia oryzae]
MDTKANQVPYNIPADAVWFITGCSSGIGKSMAQQLLAYPEYRVVATARNPSSLADLEGGDDRLLTTALEVTSKESRDAAVAAALAKFGRIDVFGNNAGQAFHSDSEQSCPEEERQQFDVNFWGPMELTRHAVRVMREENPKNGPIGGVIINVTSFVGFVSIPGCPFYCASKFALEGFTETFAKEVHPDWNIHFCLAEPGGVATAFADNRKFGVPHPAYQAPGTPTREFEAWAQNLSDMGFSTAEGTAKAIIEAVHGAKEGARGRIPLRLPTGSDSFHMIKSEVDNIAANLNEFQQVSLIPSNQVTAKA